MSHKKLICRTCVNEVTPRNCKNILLKQETSNLPEMLNYCVPELDLLLVINSVICNKCIKLLKKFYTFKTECLKTEEKLLKYSSYTKSKVDINNFIKHRSANKVNKMEFHFERNNNNGGDNIEVIKVPRFGLKEVEVNKQNNYNCTKCHGCEKKLNDPSYHSKSYKSPLTCYVCKTDFDEIGKLRKHMTKHTLRRRCKLCDRHFRDLYQLTKHLRTHTGAKPYVCNLCQKEFRQKYNLTQHLRQHVGHGTVKCELCDKVFSTKFNARIHKQNVHRKKPNCELCGDIFPNKAALVEHLDTVSETCGRFVKAEVVDEAIEDKVIKTEPDFGFIQDTGEYNLEEESPDILEEIETIMK